MMTLRIGPILLLQLPRTHVVAELGGACQLRLRGTTSGREEIVEAQVQALTNCYLLTCQLRTMVGVNATLDVLAAGVVVYSCPVFLVRSEDEITTPGTDEL